MYSPTERQKILDSLTLTPTHNFLRVLKGEIPETVPLHNMAFAGYNGDATDRIAGASLFEDTRLTTAPHGRDDIGGVKYVANESTGFGCIPEPNNYILDIAYIENWHKCIKAPAFPVSLDWDMLA